MQLLKKQPEPLKTDGVALPLCIAPPAILGILFLLLPFMALLLRIQWNQVIPLLLQPESQAAIRVSLLSSSFATFICFCLGVPLALYLNGSSSGKWTKLLETTITLPMVLPPVVAGLMLLITWGRWGMVGQYLRILGIEIGFTTLAVIFAQVFVSLPFLVISLLGGLRARGFSYEQNAAKLGAKPHQILFKITLPLSFPALLSAICLSFARALGEFGATLTFAGSLPGVTRTLPLEIYLQRENDTDTALALALLLLFIALLLLLLSQTLARWGNTNWFKIIFRHRSSNEFIRRYACDLRIDKQSPFSSSSLFLPPQGSTNSLSAPPILPPNASRPLSELGKITVNARIPERGICADFSINLGKTTALMGANGAGKSTLIELLAGTLPNQQSEIHWGNLSSPPRSVLLEQKPGLFPHLNVLENAAFPLQCQGIPSEKAYKIAAYQLAKIGVGNLLERYPQEISGGQAQRVAVARALTLKPELLLLDEPFAGIDAEHSEQIRQSLNQLSNLTIVLVTHDLTDVFTLAEEIVLLEKGTVLAQGSIQQVLGNTDSGLSPGSSVLQQFMEQTWLKEIERLLK